MHKVLLLLAFLFAPLVAHAQVVHAITTGGTAVTVYNGQLHGCLIWNPLSTADEAISPVEPLYIAINSTASTLATDGVSIAIPAGVTFACPSVPSWNGGVTRITANAATSAHNFVVLVW
jgi:hypothetical protein